MTNKSSDLKTSLVKLEDTLDLYLIKKAPFQIPGNIKELIVRFGPYLTLVGVVISLPLVLVALGLGTILAPLGFLSGSGVGLAGIVGTVVLAVCLVLEAMAIPGLFKRSIKAWHLLFYATLVNALYNLVTFNFGGLIIGTLVSLYILFQVKELYK
jgi:hypothetical protein